MTTDGSNGATVSYSVKELLYQLHDKVDTYKQQISAEINSLRTSFDRRIVPLESFATERRPELLKQFEEVKSLVEELARAEGDRKALKRHYKTVISVLGVLGSLGIINFIANIVMLFK